MFVCMLASPTLSLIYMMMPKASNSWVGHYSLKHIFSFYVKSMIIMVSSCRPKKWHKF